MAFDIKQIIKNLSNKSPKMGTRFAWFTAVLVAIISLIISISVLNFFTKIMHDITIENKNTDLKVSAKVYDSIKDTIDTPAFGNTKKEIETLIKNDVIAYLSINDRETGEVIYNEYGRNKYHQNEGIKYQYYTPKYILNDKLITVGFYEKTEILKGFIQVFLKKLTYQTIFCILFGLLMAYTLSQIIIRPLMILTATTEKYKKGDFSQHIEKTNYEEIDKLIDTYNSMGESLNELYSSLEMKVEERTIELEKAYKELKDTQSILVHSEKMRSLGELVSGITHELNNPINFVYGNLIHLQNYSNDLISMIEQLTEMLKTHPEHAQAVSKIEDEMDFEFIKEDLPELIKSCKDGAERAKNIVTNLKSFSRMDANNLSTVDLAYEIDAVLNILNNKIKNRITVHKDYQPNFPIIDAYTSQIGHVFMNIIDNASYAIKDKGNIYISMSYDEKYATIKITDDGCGMKKEDKDKIFEPFFTTKPVGEGTGLGMSITYKVIKNHNGEIFIDSEEGKGTTFTIKLPLNIANKNSKEA